MDFLDPKKRKAHRIKLFIGYALMAIALTLASVILLYESYGYDLDPRTGQIVQNGLVYVGAHPVNADIYLNNELKGKTDSRFDIRAGDYMLELKSDGYRSWKREFTLAGGSIEQYIYPFLFPTNLNISDTQSYASAPAMITQSPDRKLVLVEQTGSYQSFDLIDVSNKTATAKTITLPTGFLNSTGPNHKLEAVEWASDNKHVVLKHNFDGGQEFFVMDVTTSPLDVVNISKTLNVPFTTLNLRDKKYDQYYIYNDATKTLQTASLKAGPAAYENNVLAFHSHGDTEVVYVTSTGAAAGKVLVRVREGNDEYTLRELPAGSKYLVDIARFNDDWYVAAGVREDQRVFLFKNPVATIKNKATKVPVPIAVLRTPGQADYISFSANARFVASQSGSNFAVYDAETERQYRYDASLNLPAGQKVTWMDGHRLTTVVGDKTVVMDYDGTNKQTLNTALNASVPLFDDAYEAMFTLSPSTKDATRTALVRVELKIR